MSKGFLSILFVIVCFVGCATTNKAGRSEILITRQDSLGVTLKLTINGKDHGTIKNGETKTIRISNGHHVINGIRPYSSNFSGSFSFDCNNERIEIIVTVSGEGTNFEIRNRTILSQPQNTTPLREAAIIATFNTLNPLIPNGSKIAIVNITPVNADTNFIQEELMLLFVNSQKFTVVDRQTLDAIREEQRFGMTGEVSDETAVSIGQFLGADVVIVGNISGNAPQRRLRMRALNVKTAQVLAMSSEEI